MDGSSRALPSIGVPHRRMNLLCARLAMCICTRAFHRLRRPVVDCTTLGLHYTTNVSTASNIAVMAFVVPKQVRLAMHAFDHGCAHGGPSSFLCSVLSLSSPSPHTSVRMCAALFGSMPTLHANCGRVTVAVFLSKQTENTQHIAVSCWRGPALWPDIRHGLRIYCLETVCNSHSHYVCTRRCIAPSLDACCVICARVAFRVRPHVALAHTACGHVSRRQQKRLPPKSLTPHPTLPFPTTLIGGPGEGAAGARCPVPSQCRACFCCCWHLRGTPGRESDYAAPSLGSAGG